MLVKGNYKSTPSLPYGSVNTFLFLVSLLVADCSLPWSSSTGRSVARALAAFTSASSSPAERHSTQNGAKMLAEVRPCLFWLSCRSHRQPEGNRKPQSLGLEESKRLRILGGVRVLPLAGFPVMGD